MEETRPLPGTWHAAGIDRDPALDDLVALAAQVCRCRIAGVSLVDGTRERLAAEVGLPIRERDVVDELTSLVLQSDELIEIEDATRRAEVARDPWVVAEPSIVSYLGVPFRVARDGTTGVLFVARTEPGRFDELHRTLVAGLARQAVHLLELRRTTEGASRVEEDLAREEVRLQRIIDSITQGVVVHAPDGAIVQANPAAQRILGLSFDQMRGRTPVDPRWQTIHRDGTPFPGDEHPASMTLRDGVAVRDVTVGVARPDGERRWVLVNSAPLPAPGDDRVGAVATFSDITDITDVNDQLHDSLRELAEAAQERAALLSAVSHDIRAPLASIRLMTEILEDRADAITVDQRAELIHRVRVEARRTEGVLADLVSANRVGAGLHTPSRQRVNLEQLVRTVSREFANDDHDVRVGELSGDLELWADRAQIERILDNLISNAVRHTPAASNVVVSAVEQGDAVVLSVSDDGPGVSDAFKTRIFDAYVRGERSEYRPGSGLGLYLVQQFARFHGGAAWCEDSPEGGARFVVSLPRRTPDTPDQIACRG